jgi:hypothetical protein
LEYKKSIEYEVLDNEIDAAYELYKNNHLRASGTIAGVVLERHLSLMCKKRGIKISKTHPTISDFNDKLKEQGTYDIPNWRLIQRLGDIRNYCCHQKERDPTREEVGDLIKGVEKIIKSIY